MTTITAHGVRYTTEQAADKLAQIAKDNEAYGPSDGRVTLANAITEAQTAAREAAKAAELAALVDAHVRDARRELAYTERNTPGMGRIQYVDLRSGATRVSRYTTRDGFLRGYIKFATHPSAYAIEFVDGN